MNSVYNSCVWEPSAHKPCNQKCRPVMFSFYKLDRYSREGLAGAAFLLEAADGCFSIGISDQQGLVQMTLQPCVNYVLTEIMPPEGYLPQPIPLNICVDEWGRIFVNGRLKHQLNLYNKQADANRDFIAVKTDITNGQALSGAEFSLTQNGQLIGQAISGTDGEIRFNDLPPGTYQLQEVTAPPGYQLNLGTKTIVVAVNGQVTIDGLPATNYRLPDIPLFGLAFFKRAAGTQAALSGATFALSGVGEAVSNGAGLVNFGTLAAGSYQLTETLPPPGYQPSGATYQVEVAADGTVTVDGASLESFMVTDTPLPGNTRTVIGQVYPVAYNDLDQGADFLQLFDTVVELRPTFLTQASPELHTVAEPAGVSGFGQFSLYNVPFGNYVLYIKRPGYIARAMNVTIAEQTPAVLQLTPPGAEGAFNLIAGDYNGDLFVDAEDMLAVNELQGYAYPNPQYNAAADFNADGQIDEVDLSVVLANQGASIYDYPGADDVAVNS